MKIGFCHFGHHHLNSLVRINRIYPFTLFCLSKITAFEQCFSKDYAGLFRFGCNQIHQAHPYIRNIVCDFEEPLFCFRLCHKNAITVLRLQGQHNEYVEIIPVLYYCVIYSYLLSIYNSVSQPMVCLTLRKLKGGA